MKVLLIELDGMLPKLTLMRIGQHQRELRASANLKVYNVVRSKLKC